MEMLSQCLFSGYAIDPSAKSVFIRMSFSD